MTPALTFQLDSFVMQGVKLQINGCGKKVKIKNRLSIQSFEVECSAFSLNQSVMPLQKENKLKF